MQIRISGHHMSSGRSLNSFVEERLSTITKKYFKDAVRADVLFLKERNEFVASMRINDGSSAHHMLNSNASSSNVYESFNIALGKIEKQLRRTHSKVTSHKDKLLAKIKRRI